MGWKLSTLPHTHQRSWWQRDTSFGTGWTGAFSFVDCKGVYNLQKDGKLLMEPEVQSLWGCIFVQSGKIGRLARKKRTLNLAVELQPFPILFWTLSYSSSVLSYAEL